MTKMLKKMGVGKKMKKNKSWTKSAKNTKIDTLIKLNEDWIWNIDLH